MTHLNNGEDFMPAYDTGNYVYSLRSNDGSLNTGNLKKLFSACAWVGGAIQIPGTPWKSIAEGLIPTKTRISLRVNKSYQKYDITNPELHDFVGSVNCESGIPIFNRRHICANGPNHSARRITAILQRCAQSILCIFIL